MYIFLCAEPRTCNEIFARGFPNGAFLKMHEPTELNAVIVFPRVDICVYPQW